MTARMLACTRGIAALGLLALSIDVACAGAMPPADLGSLSLEDLGKLVVSSVAKSPEPLGKAPAAVYVISHDDIMRSGARNMPDILRLAPNLQVFQTSPGSYVITSRGFSGNNEAQNFANKLLVLIDGRSVYSPIFSGMYWDDQFVMPENIERIEVVSGPGGTLWGANAVNGVINIITRNTADTQGGMFHVRAGTLESSVAMQYGGALGSNAHYRLYAGESRRRSFDNSAGQDAHDGWRKPQIGFRVDWDASADDAFMVQGDLHDGRQHHPDGVDSRNTEGDVVARWQHAISRTSSFQLQTYFDHVRRLSEGDGSGFSLDTWDIEAQHNLAVGKHHQIVWGIGDRVYRYDIMPRIAVTDSLLWDPSRDTQNLANAFIQDQISFNPRTQLTLGLKAEHDPYSGVSTMPNARLSWHPTRNVLLWAAASRAVRTPTPFDEDVIEKLGDVTFVVGNPAFKREKLTAYEAGWRAQVATRATVSVSLYYNVYDDLRTIEFSPTGLPLTWGNGMEGHTYGLEAWGSYAVRDWWQLGAGFTTQRKRLGFKPGASGVLGAAQAGDDPDRQGFVRSMMNLSDRWTLYADLRGVGALPDPRVPGYVELDARLGWMVNDDLELSLSGFNLLRSWHQEYVFPDSDRIARSVSLDARVKF
ncbi:TonB-dependent receptor plug domain-containing protein [Frateuria hangzhouensis]|uniref:TonB-dependent receptor plug domain-containing protein n=1 Tax=Frateuria hangzhouensis TaxID=2995589 RepID=UPI00226083D5|nr:TonB-dependent receptor [Frateuria sp. STR12]MCX7514384.1 TonB-dependent receptor [Frateuria sp. STR12]